MPATGKILVVKIGRLIHVKVDINRFLRHQRGEHAGGIASGDQITAGDQCAAGAAVDGRGHFGEIQIKLRGINRRLGGANIRLRLDRSGAALLPLFTGNQIGID